MTPLAALAVRVASSLTASTSATATGASLVPVTVMVRVVVLETRVPGSLTVYVKTSVAVAPAARLLALLAR